MMPAFQMSARLVQVPAAPLVTQFPEVHLENQHKMDQVLGQFHALGNSAWVPTPGFGYNQLGVYRQMEDPFVHLPLALQIQQSVCERAPLGQTGELQYFTLTQVLK